MDLGTVFCDQIRARSRRAETPANPAGTTEGKQRMQVDRGSGNLICFCIMFAPMGTLGVVPDTLATPKWADVGLT